jgi:hypothetical protein
MTSPKKNWRRSGRSAPAADPDVDTLATSRMVFPSGGPPSGIRSMDSTVTDAMTCDWRARSVIVSKLVTARVSGTRHSTAIEGTVVVGPPAVEPASRAPHPHTETRSLAARIMAQTVGLDTRSPLPVFLTLLLLGGDEAGAGLDVGRERATLHRPTMRRRPRTRRAPVGAIG